MTRNCDRRWEIDALREGRLGPKDAEAFERHLRVCGPCMESKMRDEQLRTLSASLSRAEPNELDLRRLRARVLRSAEMGEERGLGAPRMRFVIAALFAGVACLAVYFSTTRHAQPSPLAITTAIATAAPELAGTVSPHEGAVWRQTRDGSIERVKLDDGALSIHVRHQRDDERFFVDVPDGTVEVRGTTFDVEVRDGRTVLVHVTEGIVSWKSDRGDAVLLPAGASWSPTTPASSAAIVAPAPAPKRASTIADDDGSSAYASA
ncbi:MAG: FecR domain-containing protein, partial [Polyangiaceae bacterium]